MLEGLMQHDWPLTVQHLLGRMRSVHGDREVVTVTDSGKRRARYAEVGERVDRLCRALRSLGVEEGDRVATFAWNTQDHLELYLAVPSVGAVLHTLNIRLFPEQLTYIANHAEDKVVFVDASLVSKLEEVAPTFETVRRYVVMGGDDTGSLPDAVLYEDLLAEQDGGPFELPEVDERQAAGLCYTSGTTGNPKGVLYSHRSTVLHTLAQCTADAVGVSSHDRILPIVPQFHANAWGLVHASALSGADLVMPGPYLQGEALAKLIEEEQVTVAAGVPTVFSDMLRYIDEHDTDLSSLRMIMSGGSAVPRSLMEAFEERHGLRVIQAWGMTETSPLASVAWPPKEATGEDHWRLRAKAGRVMPLVDARIVDDAGEEQPWDGESTGELEVRGPWVAQRYYEDPSGDDKFDDGWLRTGDIASLDEHGFIHISDRAKDVIKSGGEWISSVELEGAIMAHDAVVEAAVISKPDERWSERPLACVVLADGADCSAEELRDHLASRVAKWWIPDEFAFIDEVPKTSVGKFDKKVLRGRLEDDELEGRVRVEAAATASSG